MREHTNVPLVVNSEVTTDEQLDIMSNSGADGVVIGSNFVPIVDVPSGEIPQKVENYCRKICNMGKPCSPTVPQPSSVPLPTSVGNNVTTTSVTLSMRFGEFGGQYVPEVLFECLTELEEVHKKAVADPEFWKDFESHYNYMNRPSKLYYAENLTKEAGGAQIWLKREDL